MTDKIKGQSGQAAKRPRAFPDFAAHWVMAIVFAVLGAAPLCAQEIVPKPSTPAVSTAPAEHPKEAEPVYHLLGFRLGGTDRVDADKIFASLPHHKGDLVTRADITNDTGRIEAALAAAHVHGDMTTALLERPGNEHDLLVVCDVHLTDALSFKPSTGPRLFGGQTFSGNVALTASQLTAATELQPGQKMPDGTVGDARTGIEQAYDKALPGKTVDVKGKIILRKDHSVLINWQIAEPK
jgi:hypothetical protein